MSETTPISREESAAAHRKLSRQIGAELIRRMAETDTSVELMAVRLNKTAKTIWKMLHAFIDGTAQDLEWMSDLAFAMDAEWDIEITGQPTKGPDHD